MLQKIDGEVKKEVDAATAAAKADSEVGMEELTTDIYALEIEKQIRGALPDKYFPHKTLGKAVNLK